MQPPKRSEGSAAVELALVLPVLILFLTFPIFYARCFWHYTVAQKAAQDSVRYFSQISLPEMRSTTLTGEAVATAKRIARMELAELNPGGGTPSVEVLCGADPCDGIKDAAPPKTVRVLIKMRMVDTAFGAVNTGRYGIGITADAIMPYVPSI